MATIEDYICQQLESSLRVKNKVTGMFEDVTAEDGHVLTKEEGIAMNLVNQALQGDIKAIEYINRAKLISEQQKKKK